MAKIIPITTAALALVGSAQSQPLPPCICNPAIITPNAGLLSSAQRKDVRSWVNKVLNDPVLAEGPSTDPNYDEFWIRMKKADPPDPPEPSPDPETRPSPKLNEITGLDKFFLGNSASRGVVGVKSAADAMRTIRTKKLPAEFLGKKRDVLLNSGNWSESGVFGEIMPDFADMFPEPLPAPDEARQKSGRGMALNGDATISVKKAGSAVSPAYFQELLNQVRLANMR